MKRMILSAWLIGGWASVAHAGEKTFADLCDVSLFSKEKRDMHVCVDMTGGTPSVVAQSDRVLLGNRSTVVHVLVPEGMGLDVQISGATGTVTQTVWSKTERSSEEAPKTSAPNSKTDSAFSPPDGTLVKVFVIPPRVLPDGETTAVLNVRMWKAGTGSKAWYESAHQWKQVLADQLIPDQRAQVELHKVDVEVATLRVKRLEERLTAATKEEDKTKLSTELENARKQLIGFLQEQAKGVQQLASYETMLGDMTALAASDAVKKAEGRDFSTLSPPGVDKLTAWRAAAATASDIRVRLEAPEEITLKPYELLYDKGVIGAINVGTGVVFLPRNRTYAASSYTDETGATAAEVVETTSGSVDVELVATYTHYFWAVPDSLESPVLGVSGGVSFADLSADANPGSIYLGLNGGFKNLSLGVYGVVRKVDELQPGTALGQAIEVDTTVPTVSGYRPGIAIMLTLTPDLFTIKG